MYVVTSLPTVLVARSPPAVYVYVFDPYAVSRSWLSYVPTVVPFTVVRFPFPSYPYVVTAGPCVTISSRPASAEIDVDAAR